MNAETQSNGKPKLLVVDDHEHILKQLSWALCDDFEVHTAATKEQALAAVRQVHPAIVTVDLALAPGKEHRYDGFEVIQEALRADPAVKAIVITSEQQEATAIRAIQLGAFDYFVKPLPLEELRAALKRASFLAALDRQAAAPEQLGDTETGIVGESPAMLALLKLVRRVAETDFTALILGESGVGKDLVAQAIWKLGPRRSRPFVVVNSAAIPEQLLESELFGHEKGAFTGAHAQKKGKLELADTGTLFLDEIGDLSQGLQAKLLRFLQERTIERVGGAHPIRLDVRIVAATNRDLESEVKAKQFREDLYYRLNVLPIRVPPLRERGDDILLLANHFLERLAREMGAPRKRLANDAEIALKSHAWPGNVRELDNAIKAAAVRSPRSVISARHLGLGEPEAARSDLKAARDQLERAMIERAMWRNGGIVSRAARDLAVSRVTLYDLLDKHGLRPAAEPEAD